jgi:hypothetical protein
MPRRSESMPQMQENQQIQAAVPLFAFPSQASGSHHETEPHPSKNAFRWNKPLNVPFFPCNKAMVPMNRGAFKW